LVVVCSRKVGGRALMGALERTFRGHSVPLVVVCPRKVGDEAVAGALGRIFRGAGWPVDKFWAPFRLWDDWEEAGRR